MPFGSIQKLTINHLKMILVLLSLAWSAGLHAKQSVNFSVYEDVSGELSLQEIIALDQHNQFSTSPMQAFMGGYTRSAFWFKLDLVSLKPHFNATSELWLEAQPPYLDYIDLYYYVGEWHQLSAGNKRPYAAQPQSYRSALFALEEWPTAAYVRIQTHSSSVFMLTAWSPDAFFSYARNSYLVFAVVFGILLSLILFNMVQGDWLRFPVVRYYLLYLSVFALALLSFNGFLGEWVFAQYPAIDALLVPILVMFLLITITLAYIAFLKLSWTRTPKIYLLSLTMVGLGVVGILSVFFDVYVDVFPFIGIVVILVYLVWFIEAIKGYFNQQEQSIGLILATGIGLLGSISAILMLIGVLSIKLFGLYTFQVTSFIAILLFQLVLILKVRHAINHHQVLATESRVAQQKLKVSEQVRREKEQFLAMLSHEIKSPLSVINFALEKPNLSTKLHDRAMNAIRQISWIIDRCSETQRFDDQALVSKPQPVMPYRLIAGLISQHPERARMHYQAEPTTYDLEIQSDPELLTTIINNLLDNALKYSPVDSPVMITLNLTAAQQITLGIENQLGEYGAPDPNKVFTKYYRSEKTKKVTGTGLGLYLVKGLALLIDGEVAVTMTSHSVAFLLRLKTP